MIYYAHSGIGLNNRFPLRQQLLYGTYKKKGSVESFVTAPIPICNPRQQPTSAIWFGSETDYWKWTEMSPYTSAWARLRLDSYWALCSWEQSQTGLFVYVYWSSWTWNSEKTRVCVFFGDFSTISFQSCSYIIDVITAEPPDLWTVGKI